jgi:hypothetical protein
MQHRRDPELRRARGTGFGAGHRRCRDGLGPLLLSLLAQAEAALQFLGPGAGLARAVTAQRDEAIDPEPLGEDLGQAAADRRGRGTKDAYRQLGQRLLEAGKGPAALVQRHVEGAGGLEALG